MASAMQEEAEMTVDECQKGAHNKTDEHLRQVEQQQRVCKEVRHLILEDSRYKYLSRIRYSYLPSKDMIYT